MSALFASPSTDTHAIIPGTHWFFPGFLVFASGLGVIVWSLFANNTSPTWTKPLSVVGSMRYSVLVIATLLQSILLLLVPEEGLVVILWQIGGISLVIFAFIYFWRKQYTLGPVERMFRSQNQG